MASLFSHAVAAPGIGACFCRSQIPRRVWAGVADATRPWGFFRTLGDACGHGSLGGAFTAARADELFHSCPWRLNPNRPHRMYLVPNRGLFDLPPTLKNRNFRAEAGLR